MSKEERARLTLEALQRRYGSQGQHLRATTPWELLAATMLSAQCTDARVNMVTPRLFERWPTPQDMAMAEAGEVEEVIHSTGLYRNKAKNLIRSARRIVDEYNGELPQTLAELTKLEGVARKTANVVLWGAFGLNEGLAVDTHVMRIAARLGLSQASTPEKIERDLLELFPQAEWGRVNHNMVAFGRELCKAHNPDCPACPLNVFCPYATAKAHKL